MSDFTNEVKKKLQELGHILPKAGKPLGAYVDVRRTGDLLFVSGKLPLKEDGTLLATGKLGAAVDLDGALLLLSSDASAFMTGSVVTVDGGFGLA